MQQRLERSNPKVIEMTKDIELIKDGIEAFRLTREYVGEKMLPNIEGWSHYDWVQKAELFVNAKEPDTADAIQSFEAFQRLTEGLVVGNDQLEDALFVAKYFRHVLGMPYDENAAFVTDGHHAIRN